jgi:hypothetical protein
MLNRPRQLLDGWGFWPGHHDLKPHLVEHFHISNDPAFERKLEDIVGLYLNPPDNAIVLCIDEKSQVQALERACRCGRASPSARLMTTYAMA